MQDHVEPGLLFLGAEFGAFVSVNGGESWMEFSNGLPTIPVRELEIQRRDGALAAATFGRSFYVVDDYTPLRELAAGADEVLASDGHIFEVADGDMYPVLESRRGQRQRLLHGRQPADGRDHYLLGRGEPPDPRGRAPGRGTHGAASGRGHTVPDVG